MKLVAIATRLKEVEILVTDDFFDHIVLDSFSLEYEVLYTTFVANGVLMSWKREHAQ